MTTIRLGFDKDADVAVSSFCESIIISDRQTWVEITLEKETVARLLQGLSGAADNWGSDE